MSSAEHITLFKVKDVKAEVEEWHGQHGRARVVSIHGPDAKYHSNPRFFPNAILMTGLVMPHEITREAPTAEGLGQLVMNRSLQAQHLWGQKGAIMLQALQLAPESLGRSACFNDRLQIGQPGSVDHTHCLKGVPVAYLVTAIPRKPQKLKVGVEFDHNFDMDVGDIVWVDYAVKATFLGSGFTVERFSQSMSWWDHIKPPSTPSAGLVSAPSIGHAGRFASDTSAATATSGRGSDRTSPASKSLLASKALTVKSTAANSARGGGTTRQSTSATPANADPKAATNQNSEEGHEELFPPADKQGRVVSTDISGTQAVVVSKTVPDGQSAMAGENGGKASRLLGRGPSAASDMFEEDSKQTKRLRQQGGKKVVVARLSATLQVPLGPVPSSASAQSPVHPTRHLAAGDDVDMDIGDEPGSGVNSDVDMEGLQEQEGDGNDAQESGEDGDVQRTATLRERATDSRMDVDTDDDAETRTELDPDQPRASSATSVDSRSGDQGEADSRMRIDQVELDEKDENDEERNDESMDENDADDDMEGAEDEDYEEEEEEEEEVEEVEEVDVPDKGKASRSKKVDDDGNDHDDDDDDKDYEEEEEEDYEEEDEEEGEEEEEEPDKRKVTRSKRAAGQCHASSPAAPRFGQNAFSTTR